MTFNRQHFRRLFETHFADKTVLFAAAAQVTPKTISNHLNTEGIYPSQRTIEKYARVFAEYENTSVIEQIRLLSTDYVEATTSIASGPVEIEQVKPTPVPVCNVLIRDNSGDHEESSWVPSIRFLRLIATVGASVLATLVAFVCIVLPARSQSSSVFNAIQPIRVGAPLIDEGETSGFNSGAGTWEGWERSDESYDPIRNDIHVTHGQFGLRVQCLDMEPPGNGAGVCLWGQARGIHQPDIHEFQFETHFATDISIAHDSELYEGSECVVVGVADSQQNGWQLYFSWDRGNRVHPQLKIIAWPLKLGQRLEYMPTQGARVLEKWRPSQDISISIRKYANQIVCSAATAGSETIEILRAIDHTDMGALKSVEMKTGGYRFANVCTDFRSATLYRLADRP